MKFDLIVILNSIHDIMTAEDILGKNGIKVDLIPVPKEINTNCGMALHFSSAKLKKAIGLININYTGKILLYEYKEDGLKPLKIFPDNIKSNDPPF